MPSGVCCTGRLQPGQFQSILRVFPRSEKRREMEDPYSLLQNPAGQVNSVRKKKDETEGLGDENERWLVCNRFYESAV